MPRRDLHAAFVEQFGRRDISFNNIKQLCTRHGWATDPHERRQRTKGRTKFSKAELRFIKLRQTTPRRELHTAFVEQFEREMRRKLRRAAEAAEPRVEHAPERLGQERERVGRERRRFAARRHQGGAGDLRGELRGRLLHFRSLRPPGFGETDAIVGQAAEWRRRQ